MSKGFFTQMVKHSKLCQHEKSHNKSGGSVSCSESNLSSSHQLDSPNVYKSACYTSLIFSAQLQISVSIDDDAYCGLLCVQ